MLPSFDLSPTDDGQKVNYRPRVFNTHFRRDARERVSEVILRSTAAPTYFPIVENRYIDGGVSMNNPSMAALSFALNGHFSESVQYGGMDGRAKGLARRSDEIGLLSIGTGIDNTLRIEPDEVSRSGDWGVMQWAKHLADMLVQTNEQATEYYVKNILSEAQYLRVEFDLTQLGTGTKVPIDCVEPQLLQRMKSLALWHYEHQKNNIAQTMAF
jgi:patatin-like phospholipase/acyl hydrolase